MPARRINARPVNRTRARHLPKHSPELSLDVDAAPGSYRIDKIAAELYNEGVFSNREPFELFLKNLRRSVDLAGCFSLQSAQFTLVRSPNHLRLTKRFFEDIKTISHLIERNEKADPLYIMLSAKYLRRSTGGCRERTSSLLTKLREVRAEIEGYLLDYRLGDGCGGNRDPLSNNFISEMLDVWRDFSDVPPEQAAAERAYIESARDTQNVSQRVYAIRPSSRRGLAGRGISTSGP
jgi:hypothetical protein